MLRAAAAAAACLAAVALVACRSDSDDAERAATDVSLVPATPPPTVPTPSVDVPQQLPTELVVTTLTEGTGREAEDGDTVLVNYVGVRSEDGTEFDSSFGREPFPVTLGESAVIEGWQQGLAGAQGGERLQLDIPPDLAYGDDPRGTVIQPGDALSFVIDVLVVVPPNDLAEAPTEEDVTPLDAPLTAVEIVDDREGDGATIDLGMTGFVNFVLARADNGVVLASTWSEPGPAQYVVADTGPLSGLVEGVAGMKVGGRRTVKIPYEQAFGAAGETTLGLPAETDVIVIVDLVALYGF
ncbi:MAG: FKBP-type peptidyl-prolyl cis-trans isomerase [Acidimicrobiia bacterium]|nr:FKBP-type peptidyl-prolyl cis-trans isomerase [Acidimicrobiia bacterium]